MNTNDLYEKVCNGRFCRLEDKIDSLDKKFDNKIDRISREMSNNHNITLNKIETLTSFKFRLLGAISVIVVIVSIVVSLSVAHIRSKKVIHNNYNTSTL